MEVGLEAPGQRLTDAQVYAQKAAWSAGQESRKPVYRAVAVE